MAKEVVEVAHVFADTVVNREFNADEVSAHAVSGDRLSIHLVGGSDGEGPVLAALITPNFVVIRRPAVEDGRR